MNFIINERHGGVWLSGAVVSTSRALVVILACAQTHFGPMCRLLTCTIQGKVIPERKLRGMNG